MRRLVFAALAALPARLAAAQQIPSEIVDAFHKALAANNTRGALQLLSRDLVVFEFGAMDATLQAYAFAHLPADMTMAYGTEWELQLRRVGGSGDARWVISSYKVTGTAKDGTPINQTQLETVLLDRIGGEFKISHIHWSNPPGAYVPPASTTPPAPAR
ncbi:MAG: nuclear transport factor 2 family protein [Bauldia sp.]